MSLSHQRDRAMSETKGKADRVPVLECPECGALAMRPVVGRCRLRDGTLIPRLRRLRCTECGANFFDDAAMAEIEAFRSAHAIRAVR